MAQSTEVVSIAKGELDALRRDLAEQERLLAAYDDANRDAAQRVKALEATLRAREAEALEERRHLEREVLRAAEAQQSKSVDTAHSLRRLLEVEGKLEAAAAAAASREGELAATIEGLRRDKRELEARAAGVDLPAMQQGDDLVRQVREEMASMRAQYERQVASMHGKLLWYADNQAIVTENEALLGEQSRLITKLRARLEAASRGTSQRRIAELQQQVEELKAARAGEKGGMVAALVREAAEPLREQEAQVQELRDEVQRQRDRADEVAATAERQVRALMQQHEKLKAELQGKAATQERRGQPRRVQELEQQVAEVRAHYQRKVRSLQEQLDARGASSQSGSAGEGSMQSSQAGEQVHVSTEGHGAQSSTKQWTQLRQQVSDLRQTVRARDATIVRLHSFLASADGKPGGAGTDKWAEELQSRAAHAELAVAEARKELATVAAARTRAEAELEEFRRATTSHTADLQAQVVQLEARLEASHTMVQSLSQANSATTAALQESRQQHAAELQRLTRAQDALVSAAAREAGAVEAEHARERAGELQGRLQAAQRRIEELQREVQDVKRSKQWAPSAHDIVALEDEVQSMSQRLAQEQQQWQGFLTAASAHMPHFKRAQAGMPGGKENASPLSPAALSWSEHATGALGGVPAQHAYDAGAGVRERLQFLQAEVEKVIASAAAVHGTAVGSGSGSAISA